MKKRFTLITVAMMLLVYFTPPLWGWGQTKDVVTIYSETFGDNGSSNTAYGSYSGYSATTAMFADGQAVKTHYSGTGKVGKNSVNPSADYTGASGLSAAWYGAGTGSNTNNALVISGINISGYTDLGLSFGMFRTNGTSSTNVTSVTYSIDGGSAQTFSFTQPTSSSTWTLIEGNLSGTGNSLTITFTMTTSGGFTTRYDDIIVTGTSSGGGGPTVATPTFSPAGGNYATTQNVTISCATDGATIRYTTDGNDPTNSSTVYSSSISISTTTILKAKAFKNSDESGVASATYTILTPLTTMDEIFTSATSAAGTPTPVAITFDNWVVSGVNGNNAYVTDGTKGFIVYQSGHGFAVGNILSGTALCNIQLYYGSAELTDLTATTPGLTVNTGGVITPQIEGIASLGGVNTGAVYAFSGLTCSKPNSTTVTLSDGESNELKVLKSLYNDAFDDFSDGLVYNVTGVYLQYNTQNNSTKEILPRAAADIEVVTIPSITASNVNLAYNATSGEIPYTINYPKEGGVLTAAKDASDWISNVMVDGANNKVTFNVSQNTTNAARNGVITLTYTYTAKVEVTKDVTITQGVRDYAELPVIYDGGKGNLPIGFTYTGLGSDYDNSPKLKFDTEGDNLILKINEAAVQLHFDIKSNSAKGTFKVQTSANGTDYSDLGSYTYSGNDPTTTKSYDLASNVRYIKWIYSTRTSGNVALGNIRVSADSHDLFVSNTINDLDISLGDTYTVYSPAVLTLTGSTTNNGELIIKEGAQLIHTADVTATLEKEIAGYGGAKGGSGWYTIASPVDNTPVSTLTTGTYDLYSYDEANHLWYNQEAHTGTFTTLSRGHGYLYANASSKVASFTGSMKATNAEVTVGLSYASDADALKGFNLVGNPFSRNLVNGEIKVDGVNLTTYYMIAGGDELLSRTLNASNPIKPGQGFIVQATAENQDIVFNPSSKGEMVYKPSYICIEAGDEAFMDCAYVQVGQGNTLRKMTLNESVSHVYVLRNGKDYAATTVEAAKGEMPVNFKAAYDGNYSISVSTVGLDLNYLHLIDKLTGNDIDLLATPEYTFSAKRGDGENRFRLVFEANGNALVTSNEPFAYFNGSEWVIENDGNATLQVIDVMGRMLRSENVSGNATTSLPNLSAGVYVLRLVNSESIRTQKVVIE